MKSLPELIKLISELDHITLDYELVFKIARWIGHYHYKFEALYNKGEVKGFFIDIFLEAIDNKEYISHNLVSLLRAYAIYLRDGIALIAFTERKAEVELIKQWADNLYIMYNEEEVTRYEVEYCNTHDQFVPEDDPCPNYSYDSDDSCDIDDTIVQTKIIIYDYPHTGTFEELNFEWDYRYVNGGYISDTE